MASHQAHSPPSASAGDFTPAELSRYARHLTLPDVGLEGQSRLKQGSVLCVGAGGLGSPATLYLAAAGVGRIGIVDPDIVDSSNLQRQILHGDDDIGKSKLVSAEETLRQINPHVTLELHETRFESSNAMEMVADYDIVVDGTDNFATRYLSNDVCVLQKKPNVYGSIFRFEGQCSVFAPHLGGPCYRCMFPEPPDPGMVPSCAEGGVLGVLPGIIGSMQALEAIKILLEKGDSLLGRLVHFDALRFRFREFKLRRDPECPVCGDRPTITEPIDYDEFCGLPGAAAAAESVPCITVQELLQRQKTPDRFLLLDVREPFEHQICRIEGARLLPLGELQEAVAELRSAGEIVIHCKSGGRSEKALRLLQEHGIESVVHVTGGIDAWRAEIDPSLPSY